MRPRRPGGDDGTTLAEVLVAGVLTTVLGTVLLSAFVNGNKLFRLSEAEVDGQTDVRLTIERLGRDVRAARGIAPGANASELSVWIDRNSDYVQQAAEIVTWRLVASSEGHFDVTRLEAGSLQRQSRFIISELAFCYRASSTSACLPVGATGLTADQANSVRVVSSNVEYDPVVGAGTESRQANFEERLRNVG